MKLRTRLLATFGLLALTTFSISIVGYLLVSRFSGALYEVGVVRLPSIQGLDTMREALHELARAEHRRHRATEDRATMKAEIELAGRQWQRFDEGVRVYEPLAQVPQEAELWRRFVAVIAELRPLHEAAMARALARIEGGAAGKPEAVVPDEAHLAEHLNSAQDLLFELLRLNTRIAENALAGTARTSDEVANVGHVMLGFAAFALFLHFWLAFSIGRSVTRPVEDAERAIRRIAGGDLEARVPVSGDDELGRLSGSVNHLAVALQESEALRRAVGTNLRGASFTRSPTSPTAAGTSSASARASSASSASRPRTFCPIPRCSSVSSVRRTGRSCWRRGSASRPASPQWTSTSAAHGRARNSATSTSRQPPAASTTARWSRTGSSRT